MCPGPAKRDLQRVMKLFPARMGGTRERAGDGRVGDFKGVERDEEDVVLWFAGALVRGPVGLLAGFIW